MGHHLSVATNEDNRQLSTPDLFGLRRWSRIVGKFSVKCRVVNFLPLTGQTLKRFNYIFSAPYTPKIDHMHVLSRF